MTRGHGTPARPPRGRDMRRGWRRYVPSYLFASPWLIGLVVLLAGPLVLSLLLSFCQWNGIGGVSGARWVGLENYSHALFAQDRQGEFFRLSLYNTAVYALFAVPLGLCASLGLAVLLNRKLPALGVFRTIFYLPHVVAGVATIMMWQWMFHPDLGLVNAVLGALGVNVQAHPTLGWLYSPQGAKPALIIMSLWGAGGAMLIFLAALQNVPEHLYEAARVDGAGQWRQFWHVTVPQISPAIFFNLVMGIIGAMQVFAQPFLLYNRQQGNSILMVVPQIYYEAFQFGRFGYASALAWILLVIILAATGLVLWSSRFWVYYEGDR